MIVELILLALGLLVVGTLTWAAYSAGLDEGWRQAGAWSDAQAYQYRMAHQDMAPAEIRDSLDAWPDLRETEDRPASRDPDA